MARTLRLSVEASASSLPEPHRQRRLGPYTALVGRLERLSERHASNRPRAVPGTAGDAMAA
ncbi:hypothetical protein [Skermanella aerolata]|uniref:hypothetical protein n=1 Tax=Skermanella aerolata TaxID=393310 RepID=UPI0005E60F88|nr:hypothetical protein [Skermanella aerolata]KJB91919.1 hypothetical protein N826_25720 [Skermanella aerolata KACC 11604]